jgi:hypothetical protein
MKYTVKRGYSYCDPKTRKVTGAGGEVTGDIDNTQMWKLIGSVVQTPQQDTVVKKTFDALVRDREKIEKERLIDEDAKKAKTTAKTVQSDVVKKPKVIDYDAMVDV